ncbi:MAG TPA: pyrroloquinoline quinone biosynthesis protein PqqB [Burkholderiales bacterium]|nr:pyrroloquinoline quinone biosynthesis protein PqqB [Burkholderiales bacterium]HYA46336.1 pyrroloquinoline quinone biosynthesis protein PqqB [Burkholderiales bacterium]
MRIKVLGAAAGGGFPQWNCGCPNCRDVRSGALAAKPLTQECVAVSADAERWFLLNASPEIRSQIESFRGLHPRGPRHSPIAGILLTNGDLDHCLGLLSLRESHPLVIYATERVRRGFTEGNVLYRTLQRFPGQVTWHALELGVEIDVGGLAVAALPAPGKQPIHLEGDGVSDPGDNIGLLVREPKTGKRLAYFSAAAAVTPAMRAAFDQADCVFFDGTFWASDELIALGLGDKRAEQMAHLPVGGKDGSLRGLAGLRAPKRIYIHVNNTNPLLRARSPERAQAEEAGWEIAYDGMEIAL